MAVNQIKTLLHNFSHPSKISSPPLQLQSSFDEDQSRSNLRFSQNSATNQPPPIRSRTANVTPVGFYSSNELKLNPDLESHEGYAEHPADGASGSTSKLYHPPSIGASGRPGARPQAAESGDYPPKRPARNVASVPQNVDRRERPPRVRTPAGASGSSRGGSVNSSQGHSQNVGHPQGQGHLQSQQQYRDPHSRDQNHMDQSETSVHSQHNQSAGSSKSNEPPRKQDLARNDVQDSKSRNGTNSSSDMWTESVSVRFDDDYDDDVTSRLSGPPVPLRSSQVTEKSQNGEIVQRGTKIRFNVPPAYFKTSTEAGSDTTKGRNPPKPPLPLRPDRKEPPAQRRRIDAPSADKSVIGRGASEEVQRGAPVSQMFLENRRQHGVWQHDPAEVSY